MNESAVEPALQVVKGKPTEDELAAVLMVLKARTAESATTASDAGNGWSAYWRAVRAPLRPGPGGWRASGREA